METMRPRKNSRLVCAKARLAGKLSATQADPALGVSPRGISSGLETDPALLCTRRGANSLAFVSYCVKPLQWLLQFHDFSDKWPSLSRAEYMAEETCP